MLASGEVSRVRAVSVPSQEIASGCPEAAPLSAASRLLEAASAPAASGCPEATVPSAASATPATASSSVPDASAAATARSAVSSGATAGSWRRGTSSPSTSTGTPAAVRARRTVGTVREPARTITAISLHGTPSSRWALRRMSAMLSSSVPEVGYVYASTRPPSLTGASSRWARTFSAGRRVSGMRWVSSRVAASRPAPERRDVRSTATGAGRPSARGKVCGKSRMPFTSAPRNV